MKESSAHISSELSRELTLFHITMMGLGMMIGAGVFLGIGNARTRVKSWIKRWL